ncbi:MAG: D-2-hydroxyacid dehydrogenase [Thermomicrobiales bacterium]
MATNSSPLIKIGLLYTPPPAYLDRLQAQFPEIAFASLPSEGDSSSLLDCDAILAWRLEASDVEAAPRLRWVQWVGAGVEEASLEVLKSRGIVLTNNRGVHAPNIAEHLLMMMLAFTRRLPTLLRLQEERHWIHWSEHERAGPIGELNGSTLVIVGAGNIGSALATRADAFGMRVSMVGRRTRQSTRPVAGIDQLDSILPQADHVAICLPLTRRTNRLFDAQRLARMKRGAFLYNVGRGPIVDTDALVDALTSGQIGGAGLDVCDPEPLTDDHPLWASPNTILTAHTAGITPRYWDRGVEIFAENIRRFLNGEELMNTVDWDQGY